MNYNFDTVIDRSGTNAYKLELRKKIFGNGEVIPLWVADMDFGVANEILEAIRNRANHPVMGYSIRTESFELSVLGWLNRRFGWSIEPNTVLFAPGVVPSLVVSILALTEPGDEVVIQTPVYPPFFSVVKDNNRKLIENKLVNVDGRYEVDFQLLESQLASERCKMLLLCSPHNPVGRVWSRDELLKIGALCLKYNVVIVSDEIHADLVLFGNKHIPIASISNEFSNISVTCIAPSKTFNIAGLSSSVILSENRVFLNEIRKKINGLQIHSGNIFGNVALEAAYNHGDLWLEEVLTYIEGNVMFVLDFFKQHMPDVKIWKPEATFLLWIDFSAWGLSQAELKDFMVNKALVGLNDGVSFGDNGQGFLRMNIASSRIVLEQAMSNILAAYHSFYER